MLGQLQNSITSSGTILSNLRRSLYLGDFQGMMEFFSFFFFFLERLFKVLVLKTLYIRQGSEHLAASMANIIIVLGWCMHANFAEGLERLFCKSQGLTCPDDLKSLSNGAKTEEDFEHLASQEAFKVFERLYEEKRNQCL